MSDRVDWNVVKDHAAKFGLPRPADLRRYYARLCQAAGGELEQIQFLLGHVSVQTSALLSRNSSRRTTCTQVFFAWSNVS
jgi:integrase